MAKLPTFLTALASLGLFVNVYAESLKLDMEVDLKLPSHPSYDVTISSQPFSLSTIKLDPIEKKYLEKKICLKWANIAVSFPIFDINQDHLYTPTKEQYTFVYPNNELALAVLLPKKACYKQLHLPSADGLHFAIDSTSSIYQKTHKCSPILDQKISGLFHVKIVSPLDQLSNENFIATSQDAADESFSTKTDISFTLDYNRPVFTNFSEKLLSIAYETDTTPPTLDKTKRSPNPLGLRVYTPQVTNIPYSSNELFAVDPKFEQTNANVKVVANHWHIQSSPLQKVPSLSIQVDDNNYPIAIPVGLSISKVQSLQIAPFSDDAFQKYYLEAQTDNFLDNEFFNEADAIFENNCEDLPEKELRFSFRKHRTYDTPFALQAIPIATPLSSELSQKMHTKSIFALQDKLLASTSDFLSPTKPDISSKQEIFAAKELALSYVFKYPYIDIGCSYLSEIEQFYAKLEKEFFQNIQPTATDTLNKSQNVNVLVFSAKDFSIYSKTPCYTSTKLDLYNKHEKEPSSIAFSKSFYVDPVPPKRYEAQFSPTYLTMQINASETPDKKKQKQYPPLLFSTKEFPEVTLEKAITFDTQLEYAYAYALENFSNYTPALYPIYLSQEGCAFIPRSFESFSFEDLYLACFSNASIEFSSAHLSKANHGAYFTKNLPSINLYIIKDKQLPITVAAENEELFEYALNIALDIQNTPPTFDLHIKSWERLQNFVVQNDSLPIDQTTFYFGKSHLPGVYSLTFYQTPYVGFSYPYDIDIRDYCHNEALDSLVTVQDAIVSTIVPSDIITTTAQATVYPESYDSLTAHYLKRDDNNPFSLAAIKYFSERASQLVAAKFTNRMYRGSLANLTHVPNLDDLQTYILSDEFTTNTKIAAKPDGAGYYFSVELSPINAGRMKHVKQNVYFVVDKNTSLPKHKFEAYKSAITKAIDYLHPDDTFNIIIYDKKRSCFSSQPVYASNSTKKRAKKFIGKIRYQRMFSSHSIGNILASINDKVTSDSDVNTVILLSNGASLYSRTTKGQQNIQQSINDAKGDYTVYTATAANANNLRALEKLGRTFKGRLVHSKSNVSFPRHLAKLVKSIRRPIAKDLFVTSITTDSHQVKIFPGSNLFPDMYSSSPTTIYGYTDSLQNFDLIIQGKIGDEWMNVRRKINLRTAQKGGAKLRKVCKSLDSDLPHISKL